MLSRPKAAATSSGSTLPFPELVHPVKAVWAYGCLEASTSLSHARREEHTTKHAAGRRANKVGPRRTWTPGTSGTAPSRSVREPPRPERRNARHRVNPKLIVAGAKRFLVVAVACWSGRIEIMIEILVAVYTAANNLEILIHFL